MAARGSFQKRQKEAERREKRQLKLDRRQGRLPANHSSSSEVPDDQKPITPAGSDPALPSAE